MCFAFIPFLVDRLQGIEYFNINTLWLQSTGIFEIEFPFLSSNIPSSPAYGVFISQLIWYARACSSYECLFRERRDFHVSFSGRYMSGNVWNRPQGSSMVDMGVSLNNMKSPSPKCYMIFCDMIMYSDTPIGKTFHLIVTLLPNKTLLPFCRHYLIPGGFHRTFATGVARQQRTLTPPDTWSCPIWDLHLF